ncbi:MAG: hypothetical protein R3B48_18220 [Kofleriaceae bacterium]
MSSLLFAFLGVLLVPLFMASWRLSLAALCGQGLLLAWIGYQREPSLAEPETWLRMLDLVGVRALAAPLALYSVLRARGAPPRNDVLPPNLMAWTLAIALVFVSFRFSERLAVDAAEQTSVAVATAALLLGLLVLATQTGPFSQMIGVLRVENAIALFELGHPGASGAPLAMRAAQLAMFALTVALFRWYLRTLPLPARSRDAAPESPLQ